MQQGAHIRFTNLKSKLLPKDSRIGRVPSPGKTHADPRGVTVGARTASGPGVLGGEGLSLGSRLLKG